MRYGFGQIDINELVAGMETIITRNNEFINELIEPFIPLYTYLRMVLEKTNAPKDEKTQIVPFGSIPDIDDMSDDIKIKDINNYVCENDCLKILITTDTSLLEEKLKPLKEICAIYKTQKTLPV